MRFQMWNFNFHYFHRLRIRPRVLIDVSRRSTKCNLLGIDLDFPIAIAPTAMHKMAHFEGELATSRGKSRFVFFFISSLSAPFSIVFSIQPPEKWTQFTRWAHCQPVQLKMWLKHRQPPTNSINFTFTRIESCLKAWFGAPKMLATRLLFWRLTHPFSVQDEAMSEINLNFQSIWSKLHFELHFADVIHARFAV